MHFKTTLADMPATPTGPTMIIRVETEAGARVTLAVCGEHTDADGMPRVWGIEGVDRELAEPVASAVRGMWDRRGRLGLVGTGLLAEE